MTGRMGWDNNVRKYSFISGSIFTTMAVATERFITVCHPFFKISHPWSARRYIIPILIFSIAYNAPKLGEFKAVRTTGKTLTSWG
jgi:hypothetical protein